MEGIPLLHERCANRQIDGVKQMVKLTVTIRWQDEQAGLPDDFSQQMTLVSKLLVARQAGLMSHPSNPSTSPMLTFMFSFENLNAMRSALSTPDGQALTIGFAQLCAVGAAVAVLAD